MKIRTVRQKRGVRYVRKKKGGDGIVFENVTFEERRARVIEDMKGYPSLFPTIKSKGRLENNIRNQQVKK